MRTAEQVKAERSQLIDTMNGGNFKELATKLKTLETELQQIEKAQKLKSVNEKQARLRELAALVYDAEQPSEDITTNAGDWHKTKVKKYPKLAALPYAYGKWESDKLTEIRVNGERFQMYRTKHEYNKPTEYTRPETFDDFLALNSICPAPIAAEQFDQFCEQLEAANKELEAAIEKYSKTRAALNVSNMQYWGLVRQSDKHVYQYSPNI